MQHIFFPLLTVQLLLNNGIKIHDSISSGSDPSTKIPPKLLWWVIMYNGNNGLCFTDFAGNKYLVGRYHSSLCCFLAFHLLNSTIEEFINPPAITIINRILSARVHPTLIEYK